MAVSLGDLVLNLKLDASSYDSDLENAHKKAIAFGKGIEKNLRISPTVDHTELTLLNKHLDLKQKHIAEVRRDFATPLKPRVDTSEIDALNAKMSAIKSQSIKVGISGGSSGGRSDKALADEIGRSVANNMKPGVLGRAAGAVGAVGKVGVQIAGATVGQVGSGIVLGVTQEITKNLGQGLSKSIEKAIGGIAGSTELVGEKLGEKLSQGISGKITDLLPKEIQDLAQESIKGVLGEQNILRESLYRSGQQRTQQERRTPVVREQATFERREALRREQDAKLALQGNAIAISQTQQAYTKGQGIQDRLQFQQKLNSLQGIDNTEINAALDALAEELTQLAEAEAQLVEEQDNLRKALEKASEDVKRTKGTVESVRPEQQPQFFKEAVRTVAGKEVPESMMPKLVVADRELRQKGARAIYGVESNSVKVTKELYDAINSGQLTLDQMEDLLHELQHATDFNFGTFKGVEARRENRILTKPVQPTTEELQQIAPLINQYSPEQRGFEINAEVAGKRNAAQMYTQQQQGALQSKLLGVVGFGGVNFQNQANQQMNAVRSKMTDIQQIAQKLGIAVGDGFADLLKQLEESEQRIAHLSVEALQVQNMSPEGLSDLMERYGQEFEALGQIQDSLDKYKEDFKGRAKVATVAQTAGKVAGGAVNAVQGAINSPQAQALAKGAMQAAQAVGTVAKGAYRLANGIEAVALDIIPMGRSLKAVGQQVVIPAAAFGAAAHFLPGGQMAAQGLTNMAQGAIAPIAHSLGGSASGAATELIGHAVPNVMGLQSSIAGAISGAIEAATSAAGSAIAQAGAAVVGGKMLQNAAALPIKAIAASTSQEQPKPLALPSAQQEKPKPLVLPMAMPEPEKVALELPSASEVKTQSAALAISKTPQTQLAQAQQKTAEVAKAVQQAAKDVAFQAGATAKDALDRAQKISGQFRGAYANLKDALKKGDTELAKSLAKSINEQAKRAQKEIAELTKGLGDQARFGTKLGSQLANTKSQISRATNSANRVITVNAKTVESNAADELESQRISLPKISRAQIEDAGVNTAGLIGSIVGGHFAGPMGALGGDLMGALAARQALTVGKAGTQAFGALKDDPTFQAARAMEKFARLVEEVNKNLQSEAVQKQLGNDLTGDIAGWGIGNASAAVGNMIPGLGGIPFKGAAVAMATVPHLVKMRERIQDQLSGGGSGELESQRMLEFEKSGGRRGMSDEQRKQLEEIDRLLENAIKSADQFDVAFKRADAEGQKRFDESRKGAEEMSAALANGEPIVTETGKKMGFLGNAAKLAVGAFAAFNIITSVAPVMLDFAKSSAQAAMNLQAFERSLKASTGTGFDKALASINDQADRLGTSLETARDGYLTLAAATKGTSLEGFQTQQISEAVSTASSVQQLSPDKAKLVNLAIGQIAGKGVVSMEELRQQLGENLPGAMQIAARSMGMTVAEFNKLVASGNLLAEDFLPKFAQQMQGEFAGSVDEASKSTQASLNRMDNAILTLQERVGKGILPIQKLGADAITGALKVIEMAVAALMQVLPTVITMLAIAFAPKQLLTFSGILGAATKGIAGLAIGLKAAAQAALQFAMANAKAIAEFVLIQGVIEVGKAIYKVFNPASDATIKFAEASAKALKDYRDNLAKTRQALDAFNKPQPTNNARNEFGDTGATALGDVPLIGGYLGQAERAVQMRYRQAMGNNTINLPFGMQFTPGTTFGELQAQQNTINTQQGIQNANSLVSDAYTQLGVGGQGSGELRRLRQINQELEAARAKRRAYAVTNPNDRVGMAAMVEQEQQLQRQRGDALAPIANLQSGLEAQANAIKSAMETASGPELQQLKTTLTAVQKAQDALTKAVGDSSSNLMAFEKAWQKITDSLDDANKALERNANLARVATNRRVLSEGLNQGQADYQSSIQQQQLLTDKLNATRQALAQMQSDLQAQGANELLARYQITPDQGSAQINTVAEQIQSPQDKSILQKVGQSRDLENELASLEAQLTDSQVQLQQRFRDTNRQIEEYFRTASRAAQELALAAQQNQITNAVSDAKSKLMNALTGFSDRFFGDFINGTTQMLDLIAERANNQLEAARQRLQAQQQQEDALRGLDQFTQSMPTPTGAIGTGAALAGGAQAGINAVRTGTLAAQEYGASRSGGARRHAGQDLDYGAGDSAQSFVGGVVTRVGSDPGGYGNFIDVYNRTLGVVERLAEMDNVIVKVGDQIQQGQAVGRGTRDTGVIHYEIRTDVNGQGQGGFGYQGTVNPLQFLERQGIARRQGNQLVPMSGNGRAIGIAPEHFEGDGHNHGTPQPAPQPVAMNRSAAPAARYVPRGGTVRRAERVQADPEGARAMAATAARLQLPVDQFAALMSWESAGSLNPNIVGGDGNQYQGLIQFSPENRQRYGVRQGMTIAEQMPAIERYLLDRGFRPGEMDIRGAYSAVLAGNANQRYWNRRDSNGTSVNNAAPKFRQGDHYERAQQFLRASGVTPGQPVQAAAMPAQNVTNQGFIPGQTPNMGQLNDARSLTVQNAAQQNANIQATLEAQNRAFEAQFGQSIRSQARALQEGTRSLEDTQRQYQRSREDALANLGDMTPQREFANQTRQIDREFSDRNRDLIRTVEDTRNTLTNLTAARDAYTAMLSQVPESQQEQLKGLINSTNTAIAQTQQSLDQLGGMLSGDFQTYFAQRKSARIQFDREQEARNFEARQGTFQMQSNVDTLRAGQARRQGRPIEAFAIEANQQRQQSSLEFDDQKRQQDELLRTGQITNQVYQERIGLLQQARDLTLEQVQFTQQQNQIELQRNSRSQLFQSQMNIGQEVASGYSNMGFETQAREVQKQMATAQANFDLGEQLAQLDQMVQSGQILATTADQIRGNLGRLNEIKLDNINQQFSAMGQLMPGIQQSFQGFFSGLLSGTTSLKDAFKGLIDSILSNIANLASQMLVNELFGGLFGIGNGQGGIGGLFGGGLSLPGKGAKGGGGGIAGGLLGGLFGGGGGSGGGGGLLGGLFGGGGGGSPIGGILSTVIGMFAEGGVVEPRDMGSLRDGDNAIAKALKKEGSNSVLAALTPGELVLPKDKTREFYARGMDKVLNFKTGGVVGGKTPTMNTSNIRGGDSININVPVAMDGSGKDGKGDERDSRKLSESIRGAVIEQIQKERKPGGLLWKN